MKILRVLKKPKIIIFYLESKGFFDFLSDESYLKIFYKLNLNKKLNLENPKTFNEKIQWLKLHDRNDKYTQMVDKILVKDFVAEKIGDEYVVKTLGLWDDFDEINLNELPHKFVLKCTHNSGGVVICKDKSKLNYLETKRKIKKSLKRNYYKNGREWPYKNVKPRIIAEEYIGENVIDYKFLCYNGLVKNMFTCSDRETGNLCVDFFDLEWNHLPFERYYPNSKREIKKPMNFNKMIEISEVLAKGTKLVRIDFYEINGKLYFGEITFYPGSGFEKFTPEEWDLKLGEMIEL